MDLWLEDYFGMIRAEVIRQITFRSEIAAEERTVIEIEEVENEAG